MRCAKNASAFALGERRYEAVPEGDGNHQMLREGQFVRRAFSASGVVARRPSSVFGVQVICMHRCYVALKPRIRCVT